MSFFEPLRWNGNYLHLVWEIAVILIKLLAWSIGKQIESQQAAISIQFTQRRQRPGAEDATPNESGCLTRAVQRIVPMEKAFPLRPVGNPMQLISLPAPLKCRLPRDCGDGGELFQAGARIICRRGLGVGDDGRVTVSNSGRVLVRIRFGISFLKASAKCCDSSAREASIPSVASISPQSRPT